MTLRELTPEEEAVFNLIVKQREQSRDGDYYVYSITNGQKALISSGLATKYGIGEPEQHKIIQELAQSGIIKADWITSRGKPEDEIDFIYAYNDEAWIWEKYGLSVPTADDDHYEDLFFIHLSFSQIKNIYDTCIAKHLCTLSYDHNSCRFVVECDNGKHYEIKKIKYGMLPSEVLLFALNAKEQVITRGILNKDHDGKTYVGKKSIATQVFDDDSIVRKQLRPFVKLTNDSIFVRPNAELTLSELLKLEKVCF